MMTCPRCNSTANPEGTKYCLECGAPLSNVATAPTTQPQPGYAPAPPGTSPIARQPVELKTSGMAIASLVLGIVSPCTACTTGLVGLILGIIALTQINRPRSGLKGNGLAIAGVIVSICLPLLTAAVAYPVYLKARAVVREPINAGLCMNNARNLAVTALSYAQDHQETLPTGEQFWSLPFSPSDSVYCPTEGKGAIGYGYYQSLAGKQMGNFVKPATEPLLADGGNANHLIISDADISRRHLGGYNLAYLDGHVDTLGVTGMPGAFSSGQP